MKKEITFPTDFESILDRVAQVDATTYGRTRNYIDGSVSYLSPYISRGVISTKFVYQELLKRTAAPITIQKFVQELAWRDYWQQVWMVKGSLIDEDLKQAQIEVSNKAISRVIVDGKTGVEAIDDAISDFYKTGYLHNHVRMYIATIACNMANSHWKTPAKWMYYHLLDADWASNALSWQWVSGTNSHKKYVANQENINKYCYTNQKNTFLDVPYEGFNDFKMPEVLEETLDLSLETVLPETQALIIDEALPTLIYNFYNLDPLWKNDREANRILLLEPSHFDTYPVGKKSIDFILALSKNIEGIQVFVGSFASLMKTYSLSLIYYKEHPLNQHYMGIEEPRDWMFDVKGYYPSFFNFWKKCKKQMDY